MCRFALITDLNMWQYFSTAERLFLWTTHGVLNGSCRHRCCCYRKCHVSNIPHLVWKSWWNNTVILVTVSKVTTCLAWRYMSFEKTQCALCKRVVNHLWIYSMCCVGYRLLLSLSFCSNKLLLESTWNKVSPNQKWGFNDRRHHVALQASWDRCDSSASN